ncbi:nitroreductase family protein [uncultured Dubosiella sp.]|uniref:nitroreductase family protein n=1 Tax=uncultured Dubosiella sp. TaxID=1937011 RepID=UPI00272F3FAD|nr:nitroreductase family protein [uncultured Dubosiella sp.]
MNAIFERTSVRQYMNKKADPKTIETILKAGCAAPSAVNKQPWELIVVTDPARLAELAKFSPYAVCVQDAAFAVVVCADTNRHFGDAYDVQDLSALSENMLIEAKDLGLGGVWLGGYPETDRVDWLRRYFDLPDSIQPYWVLSFGYPAHDLEPKQKWDPARIHWETFEK